MKRVGVVSYNINCNFTNYGSALQSWALCRQLKKIGLEPILVDYCPNIHLDSDPLNPSKKMWDQDLETLHNIEKLLPDIRENYYKFENFYNTHFQRTKKRYTSQNFEKIIEDERLDGFVCGSDTIFCIDEFKELDEAYFANYNCMQGMSVAYAASFGDSHFSTNDIQELKHHLKNFRAIGLRETGWLNFVRNNVDTNVQQVLDPTLLLSSEDYDAIAAERQLESDYLLLYSRRYDKEMERFADELACKFELPIVEISIRANNCNRHILRYDAGVEEFISLVKHARFIVTNSFHGIIFSTQYQIPFYCFTREQGDAKIQELLSLLGLQERIDITAPTKMDFSETQRRIEKYRIRSLNFLRKAIKTLHLL